MLGVREFKAASQDDELIPKYTVISERIEKQKKLVEGSGRDINDEKNTKDLWL